MGPERGKVASSLRSRRLLLPARYGGALLVIAVALGVWSLSPLMHHDPFVIFIVGVIFTARFLGFGPAMFGTALSVVALDYFVFEPHLSISSGSSAIARLAIFVVISLLAASLARQRSQAEVRADQTLEQIAAIVESSDDAIYSATPDGTLTSWNHGAEELYGYRAEEAIGRSVCLIDPSERAHETRLHLEMVRRGESVKSRQTQRRRKDGSLANILLSVSPLRNRKGEVIGASAIARDISAQLRAEDALRRSEKLATAGRLTAAVAHEINNPLEAITNLLYLTRHDPARADQHLKMAEREVQRIADIAQQTLGFVREVSEARLLNVSSTLKEVLQLYNLKLTRKNIRTKPEFEDGCEIHGFPGELRQLFSNLLVNAVDAMRQGGQLRLRVSKARAWSERRHPGVRVVFADNGCGIPEEVRARVFEPFYTTKKDSGTGVGLWLSEGIVRKHGGEIRMRSCTRPDHSGTVFSIFLPENSSTNSAALGPDAEPDPPFGQPHMPRPNS
jgi:PAS domain S-box-containing protein